MTLFSFSLIPWPALAALPPVTQVDSMWLVDEKGKQTTLVGEVRQLKINFESTSPNEKVIIDFDSRIELLPWSAQADKDKIEKIIGKKVTLKAGIEDQTVTIKFAKAVITSGEYDVSIKVGSQSINPAGSKRVTVEPDVAVIINTGANPNELPKTIFETTVDRPIKKYGTDGKTVLSLTHKAIVKLQMKDKYNNPTNKIPKDKDLYLKFEPRAGKGLTDYNIKMPEPTQFVSGGAINTSYQKIQTDSDNKIPSDKHAFGAIYFEIATVEEPGILLSVPKFYAAFGDRTSGAINNNQEIVNNIGFIENTVNENNSAVSVTGEVSVGAIDNQIQILINNIYPGAGKKLVLTLPRGFIAYENGSNKIYFDYDDINHFKLVPLAKIPDDAAKKGVYTSQEFKLSLDKTDPGDANIAYVSIDGEVIVNAGAASPDKKGSKLVLSKSKKTAVASGSDAVEAVFQLKDATGAVTSVLPDDHFIFIWAEREQGKVSRVDQIVKLEDGVNIEQSSGDNAVAGVYKVTDLTIPIDGDVPFGITSTEEKATTIKAAIAPDAYSAIIARSSTAGLVSNTIKANFTPYADPNTWLFSNVKVTGISPADINNQNNLQYRILRTKAADGSQKFTVSATLDSKASTVRLGKEPVTITTNDSNLSITSTDKSTQQITNGIQVATGSSGQIKFDLSTLKTGDYTVTVQAVNATGGSGRFTLKITFDEEGGNRVDEEEESGDITQAIKRVTKVVLEEQSSYLLATGDQMYALFKLYDKDNKIVTIKNDEEAKKVIKSLTFSAKPKDSALQSGKDKDLTIASKDGGILVEFRPDQLGKYTLVMTILNGKNGQADFNVDQRVALESMQLSYSTTGLKLNDTSSNGKIIFRDVNGNKYEQSLPLKGIELFATGPALEKFDGATGAVKVRKGDNYSGTIIRVTALDPTHNFQASYDFVIGHDILGLDFSNTDGILHQTLYIDAKIIDDESRPLPPGALLAKNGAQTRVTVLDKPQLAKVQANLMDNGDSFEINGSNGIQVRSDRIGPVTIRVDIRAVDPYYSSKYPVYTYITGVVEADFVYPGILDSSVIPQGYDPAKASVMYIGANTYLSKGQTLYMDEPPFVQNNRTFIPVRALGDALGAMTTYDQASQTITIYSEGKMAQMTIGSPIIRTNTQGDIISDVVPFAKNNRTFLPLRVVAELFGCSVDGIYNDLEMVGVVFSR